MKNHVHNIVISALNESVLDCKNSFNSAISEKLAVYIDTAAKNIGGSLLESVELPKDDSVTESYFLQNPQLQKAIDYVVGGVIKEGIGSFDKYVNLAENKFGVYDDSLKNYFVESISDSQHALNKKHHGNTDKVFHQAGDKPDTCPSCKKHGENQKKGETISQLSGGRYASQLHFENAPKKVAKFTYKGPIKKVPTTEEHEQPAKHIAAIKDFIANKPVPKPNIKADDVFGPKLKKRKSTSGIGKAKRRR